MSPKNVGRVLHNRPVLTDTMEYCLDCDTYRKRSEIHRVWFYWSSLVIVPCVLEFFHRLFDGQGNGMSHPAHFKSYIAALEIISEWVCWTSS